MSNSSASAPHPRAPRSAGPQGAPGLPGAHDGSAHWLLRGLTGAQRAAVTSEDAPLCVLAGAGSGKTTVLTRRVARRVLDGSAEAKHVLVVTFTRKAAVELRQRIGRLGVAADVWAGTFHAAAYAQLRRHWADRNSRPPSLLDDPTRLIRRILAGRSEPDAAVVPLRHGAGSPGSPGSTVSPVSSGSSGSRASPRIDPRLVAAVAAEVHWAQVRLVRPPQYPEAARSARRAPPVGAAMLCEVYANYVEEKQRLGLVDLDDLLDQCASLLETDEEAAAAQRWWVRHLFVDEFQDLNPAQWRLLEAWLGDRSDLFVVGDPRQAVYGWNGADPTLIERLGELLPGTSVLRLDQNHRSSAPIVAVARSVLDPDSHLGAPPTGHDDVCDRPSEETEPPDGPAPLLSCFDTPQAEAAAVVRWLRAAHRPGTAWSRLAVLARTNARLEPLSAALRRAGVPHHLAPPATTVNRPDRRSVRLSLDLLRTQPPDRPLRSALADLTDVAGRDQEEDDPEEHETAGRARARGHARGHLPWDVTRLADEHAADEPSATVASFSAWLSANDAWSEVGGRSWRHPNEVELTTFHKAKGLEWETVALVGLEDGIVPISYAQSPEALAEERRLLYVALTRAERELWCSWSATREAGEGSRPCARSPFLESVEAAIREAGPGAELDRASGLARVSELRARLLVTG
ncbi:MAG TPA: ATP-dependent helicase [Acidimicrobiales bacterium]|nr:ATP-dependent helicase [Acidimicrobiales bacterium]